MVKVGIKFVFTQISQILSTNRQDMRKNKRIIIKSTFVSYEAKFNSVEVKRE